LSDWVKSYGDMLPGGKVLGGAPANFAYHCSQLGAESWVVSAIGEDDPGREIQEVVEGLKLPSEFLFIAEKYPTSSVTVSLDSEGHPAYSIHENVAWDNIPVDQGVLDLVKGADAVCFGSLAQRSAISRKSIQLYLDNAPANCVKVFDVNLRQHYFSREILERLLHLANVLKLNDEELFILAKMFSLSGKEVDMIASLQKSFDLELIALTRGGDGSTLFSNSQRSDFCSDAVHAVDTVGAGDSFTAAMTMTYLKGMKMKDMHRLASEIAAYVCTQKGATPEIPYNLIRQVIN